MFMAGADGSSPELRPSEFKGMMRFWWRAIHPHYSIDDMKKKEGEIFGAADEKIGKSKFSISISRPQFPLNISRFKPVPTKNFQQKAFTPGQNLNIIIRLRDNLYKNSVLNLFKLSTILGGFGKRSRRGFGSIMITMITEINNEEFDFKFDFNYTPTEICNLLNTMVRNTMVGDYFQLQDSKIVRIGPIHEMAKYPYIKEIQIGKEHNDYETLLKIIGESSHKNNCKQTGFAEGKKRFASPIYVSIIKKDNSYLPIITKLNAAFNESFNTHDKSEDFISDILNSPHGGK
jgi:CRISPR-associated protein Cmr1